MNISEYYIHALSPVAISILGLPIRWYSLAYLVGILVAYFYLRYHIYNVRSLTNSYNQNKAIVDDLLFSATIGIIAGGRLGYVVFYGFEYYIANPVEILYIWQGGMSFHGATIGLLIASIHTSNKHLTPILSITDLVALSAPFGIFLGRISNFINGELYGRVSSVPWAVVFPNAGLVPRHPSQLYEAFLEGLVLLLIVFIVNRKTIKLAHGYTTGTFLVFYGTFRTLVENYRLPDEQLGYIIGNVTMGQILSGFLVISGMAVVIYAHIKSTKGHKFLDKNVTRRKN